MKLIVAADQEGGIAKGGKIPWFYPIDLRFFKFMTVGDTLICGRKTYDTLKKPLSDRNTIVVTSDYKKRPILKNVAFLPLSAVYELLHEDVDSLNQECVWIIGGESIYDEFLPLVKQIFLTRIPHTFDCDQFFKIPNTFNLMCSTIISDDNDCKLSVEKYVRSK